MTIQAEHQILFKKTLAGYYIRLNVVKAEKCARSEVKRSVGKLFVFDGLSAQPEKWLSTKKPLTLLKVNKGKGFCSLNVSAVSIKRQFGLGVSLAGFNFITMYEVTR